MWHESGTKHFHEMRTFDTETGHRPIKAPPRIVQVCAVIPGGAGIKIVELHDGRALHALVHFHHPLPTDGAEILMPAEFNGTLA